MKPYTYLLINIGSILIPFIYSFHPKLQFYKKWKHFLLSLLPVAIIFIVWDMLFTRAGIWGFNPEYLTGFYLLNLPIEEILFFLAIPYACMFTYHCLKLLLRKMPAGSWVKVITLFLSAILFIIAVSFADRTYTLVTFLSAGTALLFVGIVKPQPWLGHFYRTWLILLMPFMIVNGLLTGFGLDEPVVWYNNMENLQTRILTIPVEDAVYGMLLLLLTTTIYELLESKYQLKP